MLVLVGVLGWWVEVRCCGRLLTIPGTAEHPDCGYAVGGCDEALCFGDVETHAFLEDDGEEVGNGVGTGRGRSVVVFDDTRSTEYSHCGGQAEQRSKTPDFEISCTAQVVAEVELFWDGIVTVLLDPCNDEGGFLLVQEAEGQAGPLGRFLGEVGDGEGTDDADNDCQEALQDSEVAGVSMRSV